MYIINYCTVLYSEIMDLSKISLNVCGEKVLYVGSSIAHHCNFDALQKATGAHITTRKAYGTVWDEKMLYPHANFTDIVEREVAIRKPAVLVLQASSVDISVLKEKQLSYDEMVKAAKKSSSDIFTLAVKIGTNPCIKRIILSERTPRIDSPRNTHLTEVANEELHGLYTKAPPQQCAKIHIGTHSLQCNTRTGTSALFGTPGRMFDKYDGWHLYGPDGPRLYTASLLNILSEAGITLKRSSDTVQSTTIPLSDGTAASLVKSVELIHPSVSSGNLVGSTDVPQQKPSSVDKPSVHSDSEVTSTRLRGGGLPTPFEAGCVCIFECEPTSSECQSCDFCLEQFRSEELPPPTVDKEAGFNPVPPPSDVLKGSGMTPLEAGCVCIFECEPTSSECQSCDFCLDQFKEDGFSSVPTPSVDKSCPSEASAPSTVILSDVVKPPPAGQKPNSKVIHSVANLMTSSSVQPFSDVIVAVRDSVRPMVGMAIKVGDFYGLNLRPGIENKANGNCAIETCMDQLNFRPEFEQKRVLGEPQHCREKWFHEVERDGWGTLLSEAYSLAEWKEGWEWMRQPYRYQHRLGDMVLPGIAHCNSVDILVIYTTSQQHRSVDLVRADTLCGRPATAEAPIILAYNGDHYEGLLPADGNKIVEFKRAMLRGEVGNVISQNAVLAEIYGCPKSKSPAAVTMSKPSAPVKIVVESKSPIKSQSKFPGRHAKEPKTFIIGSSPQKRKPPVKVSEEPVKKPGLFCKVCGRGFISLNGHLGDYNIPTNFLH